MTVPMAVTVMQTASIWDLARIIAHVQQVLEEMVLCAQVRFIIFLLLLVGGMLKLMNYCCPPLFGSCHKGIIFKALLCGSTLWFKRKIA